MFEIHEVRKAKPGYYIKLCCFDNARGVESCVLSFIIQRPGYEPGFRISRQEAEGRKLVYTLESYSVLEQPPGERQV